MRSRRGGYLTPTTGNAMPSGVVVVGVQVAGEPINRALYGHGKSPVKPQTVDLICAEYWRYDQGRETRSTELTTHDVATWWDWLAARAAPRGCTVIYALNAYAVATALGVWDLLASGRLVLSGTEDDAPDGLFPLPRKPWEGYVVAADPPTILLLRFAGGSRTIKILDVRNYGPADYHELTQLVTADCEGEDWTWDATLHRSYAAREFVAIRAYVRAWIGVVQRYGLGSLGNTAATQALTGFRRTCLAGATVVVEDDPGRLAQERAALFGGRCEARRLGVIDGPIYHLDIASAYHYAAMVTPVPTKLSCGLSSSWVDGATLHGDCHTSIACVDIDTHVAAYPYYLQCERCREWAVKTGKPLARRPCAKCITVWPIGRYTTILAGVELQAAAVAGHVVWCHWAQVYHAARWLKPWADLIGFARVECRRAHDSLGESCIKKIGVALYGKLAQHGYQWHHQRGVRAEQDWSTWHQISGETGLPEQWRSLAGRVERQAWTPEGAQSLPVVTACINAAARVRLWSMLHLARFGQIYYYDTDSIWCDAAARDALDDAGQIQPGKVGYLRLIGTHDTLELRALRHYVVDGQRVCAGVPRQRIAADALAGAMRAVQPIGAAAVAGHAPTSAAWPEARDYAGTYRHGQIGPGGRVSPLVLNCWDGG